MPASLSVRGGLRAGWLHASWPLAKLTASEGSLRVSAFMLGEYAFTPDQVVAIEAHGAIPVIARGIRLVHSRRDYPRPIIFWCAGNPERLIARIQREVGFLPRSTVAALAGMGTGIPVRVPAILVAVAAWIGLFMLDGVARALGARLPGPFSFLAFGSVLLGAAALRRSPRLQAWVLKPGRSVGEINAVLSMLQFVSGLLLMVLGAALVVVRLASD